METLGNSVTGDGTAPEPYVNPSIPAASVFVKTIPDEDRIRIVELRLQGLTFKEISKEVGVSADSAHRIFNKYLKSRYASRRANVDTQFEVLLRKLEKIADEAWTSYEVAVEKGSLVAAERFLSQHRNAVNDLIKFGPQYADDAAQSARRLMAEQAVNLAAVVRESVTDAGLAPEQERRLLSAIADRMRRFDVKAENDAVWEQVDFEAGLG